LGHKLPSRSVAAGVCFVPIADICFFDTGSPPFWIFLSQPPLHYDVCLDILTNRYSCQVRTKTNTSNIVSAVSPTEKTCQS
jgi:hypothetical protein